MSLILKDFEVLSGDLLLIPYQCLNKMEKVSVQHVKIVNKDT